MENFFFHPRVVHLPIALGVLLPLLSAGLLLAWWRSWLPGRAWWVAVALQAMLVGSAVVSIKSGEHEEERVERVVSERLIEQHEEAAEVFTVAGAGVLALMLLAGVLSARPMGRGVALASVVGTLVVLGLGARVGSAGGALVYQHGAAQAYAGAGPASAGGPLEAREGHDEDDDD